jgi:hypothetical protein
LAIADVIVGRAVGIVAAWFADARVGAGAVGPLTVLGRVTVLISPALWLRDADARCGVFIVSWRTGALAGRAHKDDAATRVAGAPAAAVDNEAKLAATRDTVSVLVEGVSWWADTLLVGVEDKTSAGGTGFDWCAF